MTTKKIQLFRLIYLFLVSSTWRVAANILNKQLRTADEGWSSSLGLGEVLTTPPREKKTLLRNIHKARSFLWWQNNPEVNYSPTRISGGGVSRGSITQQEKGLFLGTWNVSLYRAGSLTAAARKKWIFRKWEGVGIGWSWLRIGIGGGHLWIR